MSGESSSVSGKKKPIPEKTRPCSPCKDGCECDCDDRSYEPGDGYCASSEQPIFYGIGELSHREIDLSWSGFGFSWSQVRSYSNVANESGGPMGPGRYTGALQGAENQPASRDSLTATYPDPIGRTVLSANLGTMGGAPLVRPFECPAPSDTVLVSETIYAPDGQPGRWIAPDGVCSAATHDNRGRAVIQIEAVGTEAQRTTRQEYAPCGKIFRLLVDNPATGQQVTTWNYGSTTDTSGVARNNLLASKTYADGGTEHYTYDTQGGRKSFTDPNGTTHRYLVDFKMREVQDRVTTVAEGIDDDVRRIETVYNGRNRVSFVTSWDHPEVGQGTIVNQVGFEYSEFDLPTDDRQAHDGPVGSGTPTVSYSYSTGANNILRRERITYPNGTAFNYHYQSSSISDALNRPTGITEAYNYNQPVAQYEYAGAGTIAKVGYSGGAFELDYMSENGDPDSGTALTGYDRFRRTTNILWQDSYGPQVHVRYGYDRNSRRTWREDVTAQTYGQNLDKHYHYDSIGQIKEAETGKLNTNRSAIGGVPATGEAWQYDSIGNWLEHKREYSGNPDYEEKRTNNTSNQIRTIDGSSADVSYDANGNMLRIPHGNSYRTLAWDAWNRLVSVTDRYDYKFAVYTYDGLFRRITQAIWESGTRHSYYNDQWRTVQETDWIGGWPQKSYCWGLRGRDDLIYQETYTGGRHWNIADAMDPVAVLNASLQIVQRMNYSPFGRVDYLFPDYQPTSGPAAADWTFYFHGQFTDPETGYQNYGFRYYIPELGRWPSKDPIGERGVMNLYCFVGNDGVNEWDFLGMIQINLDEYPFTIHETGGPGGGGGGECTSLGDEWTEIITADRLLNFSLVHITGHKIDKIGTALTGGSESDALDTAITAQWDTVPCPEGKNVSLMDASSSSINAGTSFLLDTGHMTIRSSKFLSGNYAEVLAKATARFCCSCAPEPGQ